MNDSEATRAQDWRSPAVELPVTVAAVTAVAAPVLAAVGMIAAFVAHFTIVVERTKQASAGEGKREGGDAQLARQYSGAFCRPIGPDSSCGRGKAGQFPM